jgi:hypothetical protein
MFKNLNLLVIEKKHRLSFFNYSIRVPAPDSSKTPAKRPLRNRPLG